jgi:hypothetical protein
MIDEGDLKGMGSHGATDAAQRRDAIATLKRVIPFPAGRGPAVAYRADARGATSLTLALEDGTRIYWARQSDLLQRDRLWEPFALRLKLMRPSKWRDTAEHVQVALLRLADTFDPAPDDHDDARAWLDTFLSYDRTVITLSAPGDWEAVSTIRDWMPVEAFDLDRSRWYSVAPLWRTGGTLWVAATHLYDHVAAKGGVRSHAEVVSRLKDVGVTRHRWQSWDPKVPRSEGGTKRSVIVFRLPEES